MRRFQGLIRSIGRSPSGGRQAQVSCPPEALPAPGQPLLSLGQGADAFLRETIFPSKLLDMGFYCRQPASERWRPGDKLDLFGPIGQGFSPPANSRRWLLIAHETAPDPLLPLAEAAEQGNQSVALFSQHSAASLPEHIEQIVELGEGLTWADYIAIALPGRGFLSLQRQFRAHLVATLPCPAEALFIDRIACGFGGCLSCGVASRGGWSYRCLDGPVFEWGALRER